MKKAAGRFAVASEKRHGGFSRLRPKANPATAEEIMRADWRNANRWIEKLLDAG
jgi:hypothetical protein